MSTSPGERPAAWRDDLRDREPSLFADREQDPVPSDYATLTYEVTGRIARITFNRPHRGNTITADTPRELVETVERADLDPDVHVILLSGRGKGFCGGYDLGIYAEADGSQTTPRGPSTTGTVVDPIVQARNHDPAGQWDPMVDFAMMSRFTKAFACLMHANKPTVAKIHGFCVAGGTDIALHCDQIVAADDTKIGYPPTRVWGVPSAGLWAHRLGDQRAKRLLLTGDCITGRQAAEWGLAVDSAPADELDARAEDLVERIARLPVNQLMMVKLALNSALNTQGVANSAMLSTVFDGISRHTPEGYAFQQRAATAGFREAVRERDEVFGDHKRGNPEERRPG